MEQQARNLFERQHAMLLTVPLVALILACGLYAQTNSSSIRGTVSDPSGAVVPNVRVVITKTETGVQTSGLTNGTGEYLIEFLMPGQYTAEAEVPGFKKFLRANCAWMFAWRPGRPTKPSP